MKDAIDKSKEPEPKPENSTKITKPTPNSGKKRRIWLWIVVILLSGVGAGLGYGWFFIQRQLAPLVGASLSKTLDRPIHLGEVSHFTLRGVRFGRTEVPPTPEDPDRVTLEAVEVGFNPLLLLQRTLKLDLTLIKPNVYIEQNENKDWTDTTLALSEPGAIKIDLQSIRIEEARISLVARSEDNKLESPVQVLLSEGKTSFRNNNQEINIQLQGKLLPVWTTTVLTIKEKKSAEKPETPTNSQSQEKPKSTQNTVTDNKFAIVGRALPKSGKLNLTLSGKNLDAVSLARLVPSNPLQVQAGVVGCYVEIGFRGGQLPTVKGNASLEHGIFSKEGLPQPLKATNAKLEFKDQQIEVKELTTVFATIPVSASGMVDLEEGFNLEVETEAFQLEQVLDSLSVDKLPLKLAGELQGQVKVTGNLTNPVLSAQIISTKEILADKLTLKDFRADLTFTDSTLLVNKIEGTPTLSGKVRGKGQVKVGNQQDLVLEITALNLPGSGIAEAYFGIKPSAAIGPVSAGVTILGTLNSPENLSATGSASLELANGKVIVKDLKLEKGRWEISLDAFGVQLAQLALQLPQQLAGELEGTFQFQGSLQDFTLSAIKGTGTAQLLVARGGKVRVTDWQMAQGEWEAAISANDIPLQSGLFPSILPQLGNPLAQGTLTAKGTVDNLTLRGITAQGTAEMAVGKGKVKADVNLVEGKWQADIQGNGISIDEQLFSGIPQQDAKGGTFGVINARAQGTLAAKGTVDNLTLGGITAQGTAEVAVGKEKVMGKLKLIDGKWQGTIKADDIGVERFAPQLPQQWHTQKVNGTLVINGSLDNLSLQSLNVTQAEGIVNIAGGTLKASNFSLGDGRWQGTLSLVGIELGQLIPEQSELLETVHGTFHVDGDLDNLTIEGVALRGETSIAVAGGTVQGSEVQLDRGQFAAIITAQGVPLQSFLPQSQGYLGGRVNISGNLANLNPSGIQLGGEVQLKESLLEDTLTAKLAWNGQGLQIKSAKAGETLQATGFAIPNWTPDGQIKGLKQFDFDISAQGVSLEALPFPLPPVVGEYLRLDSSPVIAGFAGFKGKIAGTPTAPQINGEIELENLSLAGMVVDPMLSGSVHFNPGEEGTLALTGMAEKKNLEDDPPQPPATRGEQGGIGGIEGEGSPNEIRLTIGSDYQPQSLLVKLGEIEMKGEQKDGIFNLQTNQIPLSTIKGLLLLSKFPLNPAIANQTFPGKISASIEVDLDSFGTGTLPVFNAEAEIIEGEMQNILALAQIFKLSDLRRGFSTPTYGTSEDLYSEEGIDPDSALLSVGFPEESREQISILTQLRRFSAIAALRKQQRRQRQEASPLPDLIALEGNFNSKLVVSKAADSPVVAEFEFNGGSEEKPWQWGSYGAKLVTLQGKFENGLLTLSPVKIETTDGMSVEVSGSLSNNKINTTNVNIKNLSVTTISDFVDLPPVIDRGIIDLDAIISGSLDNLNLGGSVKLKNATVQQTTIPLVEASISYNQGTLNLLAWSNFAQDPEPIAPETVESEEKSCQRTDLVTMDLKLPYQLPNAKSKPDNDEFSLSMSVHNKGMELLNIGTKGQVRWLGGTGCVELAVIGKLKQEESGLRLLDLRLDDVYNTATFENATVAIQALPNTPLTEVNGNISFELDKIRVEKLAGKFSGGVVLVTGDLPLLKPITQDNPLTLTLEQLGLNLKGLYKGGVGGNILITGTALEPKVAGSVDLFNGTVFLEEGTTPVISSTDTQSNGWFEFQNLRLKLGNNITVARPPILNFLATGDLSLYGNLEAPRLSGDVILRRGQINLFTTQFRLTRGYNHVARFFPSQGVDPELEVRLQTFVTENTRQAISSDSSSAEVSVRDIPGLDVSGLQTIRVEAEVFGPASQLTENLQLTSSPSRSETEIVNLLGGSIINTLLDADTTLGLARLASSALGGSALFNDIQNIIGNALGVSEFRVFPTLITDDENRTDTLGVGAEVSVDIANQFSFSVLKIINSPQPFQYGLRYRINDSILFRGSTDLSGDDRGIIEYEFKF